MSDIQELKTENKKLREKVKLLEEQNQLIRQDAILFVKQRNEYIEDLERRLGLGGRLDESRRGEVGRN